jgi:hypothetical protein
VRAEEGAQAGLIACATRANARAPPTVWLCHKKYRMIMQSEVVFAVLGSHSCYAAFLFLRKTSAEEGILGDAA